MGTTLTGKTPASTYRDLLQLANSDSGMLINLLPICDGFGLASSLQISTLGVSLTGTFQTSTSANITAGGVGQSDATPITSSNNAVTSGSGGVLLSTAIGMTQNVINALGTSLNVYPPSGAQIGTLGINVPSPLTAGQVGFFTCVSAAQWFVNSSPVATVATVSAGDSSLTITPTTGSVTAILNVANHNQWTGSEDFSYDTNTGKYFRFSHAANVSRTFSDSSGYFSIIITELPSGAMNLASSMTLGWNSATPISGSPDTVLSRPNANTLKVSNGSSVLGLMNANTEGNTAKLDGVNAGTITFQVPATVTSYPVVYPATVLGAGQVWAGDGSGNLVNTNLPLSISNVDGSLTFSPTTGAVVGSINLANSNTFTSQQNATAFYERDGVEIDILHPSYGVVIGSDNTAALTTIFGAARSYSLNGNGAITIRVPGAILLRTNNRIIMGSGVPISSLSCDGANLTVTTLNPHGYAINQNAYISEVPSPHTNCNVGPKVISAVTTNTFTIPLAVSAFSIVSISGTAEIDNYCTINLVGDSNNVSKILFTPTTGGVPCIQVDRLNSCRIEGVTIQINHDHTNAGIGYIADTIFGSYNLFGTVSNAILWENCEVYGNTACATGWQLGHNGGISEFTIKGSTAFNCTSNGAITDNQETIDGTMIRWSSQNCGVGWFNVQATNLQFYDSTSGGNTNCDFNFSYGGPYLLSGFRGECTGMSAGTAVINMTAGTLTVISSNITPVGTIGVPILHATGTWTAHFSGSTLGQNFELSASCGIPASFCSSLSLTGVQIYDPVLTTNLTEGGPFIQLAYNGQLQIDSGSNFAAPIQNGQGLYCRANNDGSGAGIVVWTFQQQASAFTNTAQATIAHVSKYNGDSAFYNGLSSTVGYYDAIAQAGSISPQTMYTTVAAGDFRVSVVLTCTTVGSAGTVLAKIGWNDEVGSNLNQIGATLSLTSTLNNSMASPPNTVVIRSATASTIQVSTVVAGATGSPAYSIHAIVTRL